MKRAEGRVAVAVGTSSWRVKAEEALLKKVLAKRKCLWQVEEGICVFVSWVEDKLCLQKNLGNLQTKVSCVLVVVANCSFFSYIGNVSHCLEKVILWKIYIGFWFDGAAQDNGRGVVVGTQAAGPTASAVKK